MPTAPTLARPAAVPFTLFVIAASVAACGPDADTPSFVAATTTLSCEGRGMEGGTGVVWGSVTDTLGQPLDGAQIFFAGTACGALSDTAGRYTLTNVEHGTHLLHARLIGHPNDSFDVTVAEDTIHRPVVLVPVPFDLDHGPGSPSWIRPLDSAGATRTETPPDSTGR